MDGTAVVTGPVSQAVHATPVAVAADVPVTADVERRDEGVSGRAVTAASSNVGADGRGDGYLAGPAVVAGVTGAPVVLLRGHDAAGPAEPRATRQAIFLTAGTAKDSPVPVPLTKEAPKGLTTVGAVPTATAVAGAGLQVAAPRAVQAEIPDGVAARPTAAR